MDEVLPARFGQRSNNEPSVTFPRLAYVFATANLSKRKLWWNWLRDLGAFLIFLCCFFV